MDSTGLPASYEEVSRDVEHEADALEWCEALIGDVFLVIPRTRADKH